MKDQTVPLCTFNPNAPCETCPNHLQIFCKPDTSKVAVSHLLESSFLIMAGFGLWMTGLVLGSWLPLAGFAVFSALFFLVIQSRITCSHCPYYAEDRRFLHCTENHFTPKIWRYHPEPITRWEKAGTTIGFAALAAYPLLFELYAVYRALGLPLLAIAGLVGILLATMVTLALFYVTFLKLYCPHCVNFSCAFNKVPTQYVEEYLRRNPVIAEAWKKTGKTPGSK
jgi:hypothetical protein